MARWNQWPEESSLLPNSRIGGAAECHRKYFSGSPSRVVREIIFLSVNVLLAPSRMLFVEKFNTMSPHDKKHPREGKPVS